MCGNPASRRRRNEQVVDQLAGKRLVSLGHEQPVQPVCGGDGAMLNCPQLVASDRLFDGEAVLQAPHPETWSSRDRLVAAQPTQRYPHAPIQEVGN